MITGGGEGAVICLLEDDESIRKLVTYALEHEGYHVRDFERPSEFWRALESVTPELVLLDIMLPEESGLQVLEKLRAAPAWRRLPVIMMTARNAEYDRVIGLDAGADDYITKPFGMMELTARIRAVLRRADRTGSGDYVLGTLTVSPEKHLARLDGREIALTNKEFSLLCLLLENAGRVLTRGVIMDRVWGSDFDGENRTVDVHIRSLRAKLGPEGRHIRTVRGMGYKMEDQP